MPRIPHVLCGLIAIMLAAMLYTPSAFAQFESASISGRVIDQTRAVIPGVEITIKNVNTNASQVVTTNAEGFYYLPSLRPGTYMMNLRKQGFRTVSVTNVTLNVQDTVARNFTLMVGYVSESITVTGDIAKLQTESATVSTVVDDQFVENMPLNGRSFQSLIYMTPGVVITPPPDPSSGSFSVNGQRTDTNYFTIDGVSANFGATPGVGQNLGGAGPALTANGGTNGLVSVDAMQEFRIQTSTYAPEFGRQPGGQISIVTKSGANQWHGDAYDFLRNDIFDARNWFDTSAFPKPPLRQNDFGGSFSGPIWKNHTFFFFSYEGLRLRLPQLLDGFFFTADAKASVPSSNPWAPVVNATPTGPANGTLFDPTCDNVTIPCQTEIKTGFSNPSSHDAFSLRIDHQLNSKFSLLGRYSHTPSNSDTILELNQRSISSANVDTLTFGVTTIFSPTLLNDFRVNWSRENSAFTTVIQSGNGVTVPSISDIAPAAYSGANGRTGYFFIIPGSSAALSVGGGSGQIQRQLNFVDTISKVVGPHKLKFGVDYRRLSPSESPGSGLTILPFSWSSILSGTVDIVGNQHEDALNMHLNDLSFFGQDTWKATNRLTMTYGLRWDINTAPVSDTSGKPLYRLTGVFDNGPIGLSAKPMWDTYHRAFAPRFGAAYQLTPNTILRGGAGMFYDLGVGGATSAEFISFPYRRLVFGSGVPLDFSNTVYQVPPFTTQPDPDSLANAGVTAVDPNLKLPVTYQWNVAVERQLGAQTLTATYVGAYGHNLLYSTILQTPAVGVTTTLNDGRSHYNALQLQIMRRMKHGLQAMASYSFSHSNDTASNDFPGFTTFTSVSDITLPPLTPSSYDVHHNFSAALSYDIPTPAWGGAAGKAILGGWAVDGVYKLQSGGPLDVIMFGVSPALGGQTVIIRPAPVPGQPIWIPDSTQPGGTALNPAAFTLAPGGGSDEAARNAIRSPYGISQGDFAVRRRFNLTERVKLDLRVEYFNIFNHPMFAGPSTFWGFCSDTTASSCSPSSSFGKEFGNFSQGGGGGPTLNTILGQSAQYAPGGPRSGQFTAKVSF